MDETITVRELDNSAVHDLFEQAGSNAEAFRRVDEETLMGESNEIGLSAVILTVTPLTLGVLALWLASRGLPVALELHLLGVMRLKLKIDPRKKTPEMIENELKAAVQSIKKA